MSLSGDGCVASDDSEVGGKTSVLMYFATSFFLVVEGISCARRGRERSLILVGTGILFVLSLCVEFVQEEQQTLSFLEQSQDRRFVGLNHCVFSCPCVGCADGVYPPSACIFVFHGVAIVL